MLDKNIQAAVDALARQYLSSFVRETRQTRELSRAELKALDLPVHKKEGAQ